MCEMRLAGRDGVDLCRTFAANANVGVVVVSQSAEEFDKVLALEVGADDYVTKPYQDRELILRIAAVMRRTRGAGGPATEPIGTRWYGRLRLDAPDRAARVNGHVVHLSPKEFVLLEALARGGGRIVPRRHLLDAVWGVRDDHDVRSLDVYIRRLRTKLQPDPHGAELIVTVRGIGHRLAV